MGSMDVQGKSGAQYPMTFIENLEKLTTVHPFKEVNEIYM